MLVANTPWDVYELDGIPVHIKREDLCCPRPGPPFSKIRGVVAHLEKQPKGALIGVLDTRHSKAGWAVAYVCRELGLKCWNFYPQLKGDVGLRLSQLQAQRFGAELFPLKGGMSAVLYNQAKKVVREAGGYMMPNALKLPESVDETYTEVVKYTPDHLYDGTWIISMSSGTIAAGVVRALPVHTNLYLHMGYSRSIPAAEAYISKMSGVVMTGRKFTFIDENYQYKDAVDNSNIPFPCNAYYDAKAWNWLGRVIHELQPPIVFWNIGD